MRLCNDEDRFSLEALSAGTWHVCVYFSHDEIDIDIGLATASGESVAVSATKEDLETIAFEAEESQSFELLVLQTRGRRAKELTPPYSKTRRALRSRDIDVIAVIHFTNSPLITS